MGRRTVKNILESIHSKEGTYIFKAKGAEGQRANQKPTIYIRLHRLLGAHRELEEMLNLRASPELATVLGLCGSPITLAAATTAAPRRHVFLTF